MTAAPLLLACLLAPQDAPPNAEAPAAGLAGEALRERAVAELEAALDAPLAEENGLQDLRPGDTLAEAVERLLPGHVVRPDTPRLDVEGIDLRDITLDNPPVLPAGRFSVRAAFEEVLDAWPDIPLTFINDGGVLKITTQDYADERQLTRTYPVRDLLEAAGPSAVARRPIPPFIRGSQPGVPVRVDTESPPTPLEVALAAEGWLTDVVQSTTGGIDHGGGWYEIDGEGGSLEFFNGLLTVRQTEAVHRQIAVLLNDLRTADDAQPWTVPLTLPAAAEPASAESAEEPTE